MKAAVRDEEAQALDTKIRILFLAADPSDLTRTRLAAEYRTIKDELRGGKFAHRFELEEEFSVKIPDLTRVVLNFRPHILHFSGHGSATGDLCFENPVAMAERAGPEDLDAIFALLVGRVDCVVLNACFSEKQAVFISKHIPYVVGLKGVVTEPAAIYFSLGFYQALSAGESIERAFEVAKALLQAKKLLGCEPTLKADTSASGPLAGPWGSRKDSRSISRGEGRGPPPDVKRKKDIAIAALFAIAVVAAIGWVRYRGQVPEDARAEAPRLLEIGSVLQPEHIKGVTNAGASITVLSAALLDNGQIEVRGEVGLAPNSDVSSLKVKATLDGEAKKISAIDAGTNTWTILFTHDPLSPGKQLRFTAELLGKDGKLAECQADLVDRTGVQP